MGIFKPTGTSTIYVQEYSWKRSPEVWKHMAKIMLIGIFIGMVVWGSIDKSEPKAKPTPAVTVTVTQTILPPIRK
jgi:hypothetical protein